MGPAVERIGRYEIIRLVGRGGMGALYQARDTVLEREVAVKVMSEELVRDNDARQRFYREARAAARLSHRNIVTVFELAEERGDPYIVMEFLRGQSLHQLLKRGTRMTLAAKLGVVADLCEALHYAHRQGVIHRDVKPANVWLLPDGSVKLLDFGIAKTWERTITTAGDLVGTIRYMAPELHAGEQATSQSDVFAAGVVLYELVTGQPPFDGTSPTAIILKIMQEAPRDIRSLAPELPDAVAAVIDIALRKDPAHRYSDAGDMASDLRVAQLELEGDSLTQSEPAHRARRRLSEAVDDDPAASAPPREHPPTREHVATPTPRRIAAARPRSEEHEFQTEYTAADVRHDVADFDIRHVDHRPYQRPTVQPTRRRAAFVVAAAFMLPVAAGGAYLLFQNPIDAWMQRRTAIVDHGSRGTGTGATGTAGEGAASAGPTKGPDGGDPTRRPEEPPVVVVGGPQEPDAQASGANESDANKTDPNEKHADSPQPPSGPSTPPPPPPKPRLAELQIRRSPPGFIACEASIGRWKGYPFDGATRVVLPPRDYPITISCAGKDPVQGTITVPPGSTSRDFKDVISGDAASGWTTTRTQPQGSQ